MPTVMETPSARDSRNVSLPILSGSGESIEALVARERERLLKEAGLSTTAVRHFKRPIERGFTRAERDHTTILLGGLTTRHDELLLAGLRGLGYNVARVPVPRKADFQAGKEYGNNGQCNPTYFTVGALVNYLKRLRDEEGIRTEDIEENYVFITAGACGPCRFGMYEAEYRLALRNSGFGGFRVLLFQQEGGLDQAAVEAGLEFNLNFFLTLLNGIMIGDLLNEVAYQIRPYEVVPGQTHRTFAKCLKLLQDRLESKDYDAIHGGRLAKLLSRVAPLRDEDEAERFLDQLRGDYYTSGMRECRELLDREVEVDYTRPKPIVKVTGEFWAQTTEGDGNFNMFPFLESQGAEVLVEPVTTWVNYLLAQARLHATDRYQLPDESEQRLNGGLVGRLRARWGHQKKLLVIALAKKILNREFDRLRVALGGTAHAQLDQLELQRVGHPYYNTRSGGGEGHLEVAKNIYYSTHGLCHMVLSLKPFGCMPSTQSDGAQAAVTSHFPDMIYLPIETSGEGDVNAHSRVQMALGEAKAKCKEEFNACVRKTGLSIDEIRAYVHDHAELRRPIQDVPHQKGVAGRAANFILHVAERMKADRAWKRTPATEPNTTTDTVEPATAAAEA